MALLGYARVTPRFALGPQVERLRAAGVRENHIWVEGRAAESWPEMVRTIRRGDTVIVDGLHRLGTSREDLHRALLDVRARGARLMDASTGTEADPAALAIMAEAFRVLAGELRIPTRAEAVRRGKLGGRPGYQDKRTIANKKIWMTAKSNLEAQRKTGVSWRTMHRWWGPSGRPAGWPTKK